MHARTMPSLSAHMGPDASRLPAAGPGNTSEVIRAFNARLWPRWWLRAGDFPPCDHPSPSLPMSYPALQPLAPTLFPRHATPRTELFLSMKVLDPLGLGKIRPTQPARACPPDVPPLLSL